MSQTTLTEIVERCPLCGSPRSSLFDRRQFRGREVTNVLCRDCGLVYQSPRMNAAGLEAFYEEEYRQLYQGEAGPNAKDLAVQRGRAEALLAFAREGVNAPARHLDIGCSAGLLLSAFQKAYGCLALGVEPGEAYRRYAIRHGFTVYPSLEALQAEVQERFDLISLAHVLEHLPDPVGYLSHLRQELLNPNGRLLVEVPHLYAHDSFEIAHLVSYSPHTLSQVLQKAGFEVLYYQEHGQPRSDLLPLYITVLARPAGPGAPPFQLVPERRVAFHRRVGMARRALLTRLNPKKAWKPAPRD
jgi:SAM-dependent methyltransferase